MAVVRKHGQLVDIPVKAGTIVKLRDHRTGKVIDDRKAIVVGLQPPSNFSRAYGRQAYVCVVESKDNAFVKTEGRGDLYPIGRAKRVPAVCRRALEEYERMYPTLARKKRR